MNKFSIGVMLESFKLPIPEALKAAVAVGAHGIQAYASRGELDPAVLVGQKRKDFLKMVKDHGLVFSAICGDLGKGFGHPELNPELIEKSKRILDLAKELETDIVTTHIGVVPEDPSHPRYKIMQDACGELAEYADSLNAHFAVETGPELSSVLAGFLDSLHSTGVAVNLDPANLVMVVRDDPVQAVHNLKKYIVHTHAKDGINLIHKNPEDIYRLIPEEELIKDKAYLELPLGEGDVPFPEYLAALTEIGYNGFLTIEREVGGQPAKDIEIAANFLRKFI